MKTSLHAHRRSRPTPFAAPKRPLTPQLALTKTGNEIEVLEATYAKKLRYNLDANRFWTRHEALVCIGCGHTVCKSCKRKHVCSDEHLEPGVGFEYGLDVMHVETSMEDPCVKVHEYVKTGGCSVRLLPGTELTRLDCPVQRISSFEFFEVVAEQALANSGEYMEVVTTDAATNRKHHYVAVCGIKRLFMSVKDATTARAETCGTFLEKQRVSDHASADSY